MHILNFEPHLYWVGLAFKFYYNCLILKIKKFNLAHELICKSTNCDLFNLQVESIEFVCTHVLTDLVSKKIY